MFKSVLVHLRGTQSDAAVLATALQAARPFAAHLECLHIRPDLGEIASRAVAGTEDGASIADMFGTLRQLSAKTAAHASNAFVKFCAHENILRAEDPPGPGLPNAAFRETIGNELAKLIAESHYHDIIVVKGGGEQAGGFAPDDLGRLLVGAGKPVLLAPEQRDRPFRTAVIAWKDAPEAARAVTAAMPLLERTSQIYLFHASEPGEPVSAYERVVRLLEWHGLKADTYHVTPGERDPADAVLEMTRSAEADLLVMGAYGQNRLSELVLGGFTQTVLEDASLPVLLFH